jgi:hypothetical protein
MIFNYTYLISLFISWIISFYSDRGDKSLRLFPLLLFFSVLAEAVVSYLYFIKGFRNGEYFLIYHLYIPLDYFFLSYFFYHSFKNAMMKMVILFSVFIFLGLSIYLSNFVIGLNKFPGLNLNTEGIFLIIFTLYRLFTLEPVINTPIYNLPVFWICVGLLIYNLGGFMFNGYYNYLIEKHFNLAKELNYTINKVFNILLYFSFSIAFLWSHRLKRYTSQS